MKITTGVVAKAYKLVRAVNTGETSQDEALAELIVEDGLSKGKILAMIHTYKCLVAGTRYTHQNSAQVIDYFLKAIMHEHGDEILAKAVYSVTQHIRHRKLMGLGGMGRIIEVRDKYNGLIRVHDQFVFADDVTSSIAHGKQILVNPYERDKNARIECLRHYGFSCIICSFNFQQAYGEVGKWRMHVHLLIDLSGIATAYELNAIRDLRPVCPNCHSMIHARQPAYTINDVKRMIQNSRR